jgi:hypothetical protein
MSEMSEVVRISNKSYTIKQLPADRIRRRAYFLTRDETKALTDDETRLLTDLGIDSVMINQLRLYLPAFFDNIQNCNTDAGMILKQSCAVPHYVLWSILFANKVKTAEKVKANKDAYKRVPTLPSAMDSAILTQFARRKSTDEYDALFEFMLIRRKTVEEIPTPITFSNNIFVLPSVLPGEPTVPAPPVAENVNDEYYKDINPIFKLIIAKKKPEIIASGHGKSFTFSQRGNTCGSDTLFTILLQADGLKTLFDIDKKYVPKNEDERKSLSYLPPRLLTLYWATERYKQMKELEAASE